MIAEFLQQGPTVEELRRAVLALMTDEYYSTETVDGISRRLGTVEFYFKDLKAQEKYLKAIRELKPQEILKVAKKYFQFKTLCVSAVTNDNVKEVEKRTLARMKEFSKTLATKNRSLPATKSIKHPKMIIKKSALKSERSITEKVVLSTGATVLMRPIRETQLVSVKAAMLGGLRIEPEHKSGLIECLGRTMTTGTARRSEKQIMEETEAVAASLSPVAGRNSIGLGLDLMSTFQAPGADLFFDILQSATFPAEAVEREKHLQLEQIKNRADNPSQTCGRLFLKNIFAGHVYAKDMLGDAEDLQKTTHQDIAQQWSRHLTSKNMNFSIVGNFDKDLWLEKIEGLTKGIPSGSLNTKFQTPQDLTQDLQIFEASQKEQSHMILGYRAPGLTAPERYTLALIQSILAGQGGRLFIELRDKNSLAYSVSPMQFAGIDTGYFGAYIGCSPEKAGTALRMMKEQLDLLMNLKVPEAELERSKSYLIGRHDIDLQRISAINSAILYNDIYGIDFNEPFLSAEKYLAVTQEDLLNLSQKIFSQKAVTTLVGPKNIF